MEGPLSIVVALIKRMQTFAKKNTFYGQSWRNIQGDTGTWYAYTLVEIPLSFYLQ
jgi:hypothetical protein